MSELRGEGGSGGRGRLSAGQGGGALADERDPAEAGNQWELARAALDYGPAPVVREADQRDRGVLARIGLGTAYSHTRGEGRVSTPDKVGETPPGGMHLAGFSDALRAAKAANDTTLRKMLTDNRFKK